jgi:hypothetical protein
MENPVEHQVGSRTSRSKGLLVATTAYGLLYLWFIIVSFIPSPEGSWVSSTVPFEPFDREQIFVKSLFVLFLVGYLLVWRSEFIGGVVFVLWWVAMWCVEILVVAPIKKDGGGGIVMGFPLFILGILFVWRGYQGGRGRPAAATPQQE